VGGVRVFRDLAEGLASRGIAVLRYDKRTKVYPENWTADKNLTMTDETVTDAVRALALLRTEPAIDPQRVFVLGHSQGGYMAPRIMKADARLAGAIVMAGNARPLEEVILDQNEYAAQLKGNLTDTERAQLEALRKNPKLALLSFPEKYRDDLKDYDPVALAKRIDIPMLILQGERDFQVSMKDFSAWKAGLQGRANATSRSFPKLNHLFVAGGGKSTPEEYQEENHVAPEVIEIAAWIAKPRQ
jgi:dipeptidyl aminopeptidase/acylaminoacyl peptidase